MVRDLRLSFLPVLLIGALFLWGPGCFRSAYRPPEAAPREDAQRTAEAPVPESPPEEEEAGQIPRPVPGPVADGPEVPGEEIPAGDAVGSSRIPSEVAPEEHAAGPAPVHPPQPAGKTQGTREEGKPTPVSTERYLASL